MTAEEVLMVLEKFSAGEIITLTTDNDILLQKVEIRGVTTRHLIVGCPNHHLDDDEESEVPWHEISYIGQAGISVNKELKGNTKHLDLKFMDGPTMDGLGVEVLSLKIPGKKYITWADPFTILVDAVGDVRHNRLDFSTPEQCLMPAACWEIYSDGLWGLMSWDSEILEAGRA